MENIETITRKLINSTNCPVFLTGKAGTGKTTFLRNLEKQTHKNMLIAAPTGVAAINAGGVTLHSLFQLPFGAFWPNAYLPNTAINCQITTPQNLIKEIKINSTKRAMIRKAELLVIDEVSMVRSDLLDAVDTVLRYLRRNKNVPFGGIQVLFIGDLLQLPPIVADNEWEILKNQYKSPYFFDSQVLTNFPPVYVEFETVYRQSETNFINILNHLRDDNLEPSDIQMLNKYYKPGFDIDKKPGYIYLATHNYIADNINTQALQSINSKAYSYDAVVKGDFPDYNYPVDFKLTLKVGAQVMFIKNDYSGASRYYNGKIGVISDLGDSFVEVTLDNNEKIIVEEYTWENKRFTLNADTNEIDEKIIGTFTHLPIKLAWAITIHKSQGLTFEKAVIDIGKAFAPGQVYVALSRLRGLSGLILTSAIPAGALGQDRAVVDFTKQKTNVVALNETLFRERKNYITNYVQNAFNLAPTVDLLNNFVDSFDLDEARSAKQKFKVEAISWVELFEPIVQVANKFSKEAVNICLSVNNNNFTRLKERVSAACVYFTPLINQLIDNIKNHASQVKSTKGTKAYYNQVKAIEAHVFSVLFTMHKTEIIIQSVIDNTEISKDQLAETELFKNRIKICDEKAPSKKSEKGAKVPKTTSAAGEKKIATHFESLKLFKQGLTIEQIAQERQYAVSTIESHFAKCVSLGEMSASDIVAVETINWVYDIIDDIQPESLSEVKEVVLDDCSWGELRIIMAQYNRDKGVINKNNE